MSKLIALRLPEKLYSMISERALREHRTLSNMIISLLLDAMEQGGEISEQ